MYILLYYNKESTRGWKRERHCECPALGSTCE